MSEPTQVVPPVPRPKKWPWFLAAAVVVAVACALIAGYVFYDKGDTHVANEENIGTDILVTGPQVPDGIKATPSAIDSPFDTKSPQAKLVLQQAAPILDINRSGKLQSAMTMSVLVSKQTLRKRDQDVVPVVLRNVTHKPDGWEPVEDIQVEGGRVTFSTDHLSNILVYWFAKDVVAGIIEEFTGGVGAEAEEPECDNESKARTQGYGIKPEYTYAGTIFWCFGFEGQDPTGDRVVEVTNRQRYPMEIDSKGGLPVTDEGDIPVSMVEAYRLGHTVIMPGKPMKFHVNPLDFGGKASLKTRYSPWGLGLQILDVLAKGFVEFAGKAGGVRVPKSAKLAEKSLKALLSYKECQIVLDSGDPTFGKLLNKCFVDLVLDKVYNIAVAALVGALAIIFNAIDTARAIVNATGDRSNDRDIYKLTVGRKKPSLAKLERTWKVYGAHVLTMDKDGNGVQKIILSDSDADANDECYLVRVEGGDRDPCRFYGPIKLDPTTVEEDGSVLGTYGETYFTLDGKRFKPLTKVVNEFPKKGDLVKIRLHDDGTKIDFTAEGQTFQMCEVLESTFCS